MGPKAKKKAPAHADVDSAGGCPADSLRTSDRVLQPAGDARRAHRLRVDRRVRRPAFGDDGAVALDRVLVAEAGTPQVDAARVDDEPVVEAAGWM